jgi:hypothetical protein
MIWEDHPPKHLHVFIGNRQARVTFEGNILSGEIEPDKYKTLKLWLKNRQKELFENWERAKLSQKLERIKP